MRIYDIIRKKRDGGELSESEIDFFINGYISGAVADYQASALCMAIYFRGMTDAETTALTLAMANSGSTADLSGIGEIACDKHSSGGVGDKTTLICAPIAAACGAMVAKMSGRGLGHTGGTIDKLESIPGFKTDMTLARFIANVRSHGLCIAGAASELAPADKLLYALRDVTATVDCMPLIASSIMSKKIASGAGAIVLDVKYGSGAFMETPEKAARLAALMCRVGIGAGRRMSAFVTDMDVPLGREIGNSREVSEAVAILRGEDGGASDLRSLSLTLAAEMVRLSGLASDFEASYSAAERALSSGAAYEKLCEMVRAQGGDEGALQNMPQAPYSVCITAARDGFVTHIDSYNAGQACVMLGAGRERKGDVIDMLAGITLVRKTGESVKKGDITARLYASDMTKLEKAAKRLESAYEFGDKALEKRDIIYKVIRTA